MKTATLVLALALAATAHAGEGYPAFSWDRVPLYAHLGIDDGLTPAQCKFLAEHYRLITFTGGITKKSVGE